MLSWRWIHRKTLPEHGEHKEEEQQQGNGGVIGIGLLDHIIIGSNGAYYSFMENTNIGGVSDGT